jgi:hypothetical protein
MKSPRTTEAEMMAEEGGGIDQAVDVQTTTRMMTIIITIGVAEDTVVEDNMIAL